MTQDNKSDSTIITEAMMSLLHQRLAYRAGLAGLIMVLIAITFALMLFHLPEEPNSALTALLGATVGYLGKDVGELLKSISSSEGLETLLDARERRTPEPGSPEPT